MDHGQPVHVVEHEPDSMLWHVMCSSDGQVIVWGDEMSEFTHTSISLPSESVPQSNLEGSGIQLPFLQTEFITGESPPQWKVICDPSTVLE